MPSDRRTGPTRTPWTRRTFLQPVGVTVPTVTAVAAGAAPRSREKATTGSGKFTPIDLTPQFNCSARDYGPHDKAKALGGAAAEDGFLRAPAGEQTLRGIPFGLGPGDLDTKRWVRRSTRLRFSGRRLKLST